MRETAVIEALDADNIYAVPEAYHEAGLDSEVLAAFGIEDAPSPDLARWQLINERIRNPEGEVTIAVVGKYTGMKDAYKSLIEALSHGGIANKVKVNLDWIESEVFEREDPAPFLEHVDGILVPGGFGQRGAEGKIKRGAVRARAQGAVFRHLLRHADGGGRSRAQSLRHRGCELDRIRRHRQSGGRPDDRMDEGQRAADSAPPAATSAAPCGSAPIRPCSQRGSRVADIYGSTEISERHRHRYEVNTDYKDRLEQHGMRFAGMSPDGLLPEMIEYQDHPWFIGVQFHPELKSRPFAPHPLFASFIGAAVEQSRLV